MSRAKAVVEAAAYDALSAAVTNATVYQDAPQDVPGDLVIIGEITSASLGGKGAGADRRGTITIATICSAEERAPLLARQEEIETALDGLQIVTADGWTLSLAFQDDSAGLSEDGDIYAGLSAFAFVAIAP